MTEPTASRKASAQVAQVFGTHNPVTDVDTQQIRRKPVLNGLINEYMHAA